MSDSAQPRVDFGGTVRVGTPEWRPYPIGIGGEDVLGFNANKLGLIGSEADVPLVDIAAKDALVAEFAAARPEVPGISQLVSLYGPLGIPVTYSTLQGIETLDAWLEALAVIRVTWREFQRIKQEPGEGLVYAEPLRVSDGERTWWMCVVGVQACVLAPAIRPELLPNLHAGLLDGLPLMQVGFRIDGEAEPGTSEIRLRAIAAIVSLYTRALTGAEVRITGTAADLVFVPINLLGAIWLRFAREMSMSTPEGPREFHECACGRIYPKVRQDQVACGQPGCAYRVASRRWDEARDMSDAGVPVVEIAKRMSASPEQVTRWIETSLRRRKGARRGSRD